ncbi:hypothetical protein [Absidia glauca]|uniref:Uncharacterized protein n=1 Tax=Absidia glauca TaxID=4829 RepID=A0A163KIV5_ABSGL|nr:hypothetical protein [Absidia glauca]
MVFLQHYPWCPLPDRMINLAGAQMSINHTGSDSIDSVVVTPGTTLTDDAPLTDLAIDCDPYYYTYP